MTIFFVFLLSQLKNNFEIDPAAAEKILIRREDFYHALEHDIKPVSKTNHPLYLSTHQHLYYFD